MPATSGEAPALTRLDLVPRWLKVWLLLAVLTGITLLIARLTRNSTIVPAALFLGALSGPFALAVWVTDRTRVGRSVAPDVLFVSWLVGGGVAIAFAGLFESDWFLEPSDSGFLWIGLVEETAKVVVPLAVTVMKRRYRTVQQALAFAIVSAAGFATFESMTYALAAVDEGLREARQVLFERSVVTPFGHLPWTGVATVVAARAWQSAGRVRLTPAALWGLATATGLHTMWNLVLVEGGWWNLLVPIVAGATFLLFRWILNGVYYDGPYVEPAEARLRFRRGGEVRRPPSL